MPAKLIGAHMPTGKGLWDAVRKGKEIGCTAVQVFTSSPQVWKSKEPTDEVVAKLAEALKETGIGRHIVSHDSYLINLAAPADELREKSIEGLKGEIARCSKLGIPYVVSHMGAHVGQGEEAGLKRVAGATKRILKETPDDVTLLMETTAGQGTCLNWSFEHLATLLDLLKGHKRLGVCLDTCHVFAAGYDLRTKQKYEQTFNEFERLVGCKLIKAVHCNDSKMPFGSRKDRHAHLGEGEIGATAFKCLVRDKRFENTPILVETPEAETMHAINVAKLWKWARARVRMKDEG
jgi:deoxyribonuclease-4